MQKDLIATLSAQHAAMLAIIAQIKKMSAEPSPPFTEISARLKDFSRLLVEHIHLEDKLVYKDIFENRRNDKASILSARSFLEEMKAIQKGIVCFLKTYNHPEKISLGAQDFKIQLREIDKILLTRIKLEEEGLFKFINRY